MFVCIQNIHSETCIQNKCIDRINTPTHVYRNQHPDSLFKQSMLTNSIKLLPRQSYVIQVNLDNSNFRGPWSNFERSRVRKFKKIRNLYPVFTTVHILYRASSVVPEWVHAWVWSSVSDDVHVHNIWMLNFTYFFKAGGSSFRSLWSWNW